MRALRFVAAVLLCLTANHAALCQNKVPPTIDEWRLDEARREKNPNLFVTAFEHIPNSQCVRIAPGWFFWLDGKIVLGVRKFKRVAEQKHVFNPERVVTRYRVERTEQFYVPGQVQELPKYQLLKPFDGPVEQSIRAPGPANIASNLPKFGYVIQEPIVLPLEDIGAFDRRVTWWLENLHQPDEEIIIPIESASLVDCDKFYATRYRELWRPLIMPGASQIRRTATSLEYEVETAPNIAAIYLRTKIPASSSLVLGTPTFDSIQYDLHIFIRETGTDGKLHSLVRILGNIENATEFGSLRKY